MAATDHEEQAREGKDPGNRASSISQRPLGLALEGSETIV
jgi:hypothetical protein